MLSRSSAIAILVALTLGPATALAADYRGLPAGWPNAAGGNYAGYAPVSYGTPGAVYAARPVTVAYANPAYAAGYGGAAAAYRPAVAAAGYYQQPATTAYYPPAYGAAPQSAYYPQAYGAAPQAAYYQPQPQAAYYQPQAAQYQPQTAYYAPGYGPTNVQYSQYAPSQSYAISPAGGSSAGSEAAAYYGQPTNLNYVPPQFAYRTNYAQVPVYMYRPVTAYQPVVGQPTTCLQPQVATTCQPQRSRSWFSWLHPHNWFGGGRTCGYSGCGSPPPQTAYCTVNYCQPPCGQQPYYPVPQAPMIIPSAPAQVQPTMPLGPLPNTFVPSTVPSAGPRMPSPPTRVPADTAPRIIPGTSIPQPATTVPSATPFNPTPGSFGTGSGTGSFGTNYPPSSDPVRVVPTTPTTPNTTIHGSGYRSNSSPPAPAPSSGPVIRAPELNSALGPSVQAVPDLDAKQPALPLNRAPALLAPRDKTAASSDRRWAVVPAVWPSQPAAAESRAVVQTKATEPAAPKADRYDDRGWTSGRTW